MADHLEVWSGGDVRVVALEAAAVTVGRGEGRDIRLDDDPTVSRLHAVIEPIGIEWSIRDLGSQNGTFVNGKPVSSGHPIRGGDEIRIGESKIVYRADLALEGTPPTVRAEPAPELTRREHDVLVALCRPLMSGRVFAEPATVAEIAGDLYVTEAAVRQHLGNLYDKFGIEGEGERKRGLLADAAVVRGAVRVSELRRADSPR